MNQRVIGAAIVSAAATVGLVGCGAAGRSAAVQLKIAVHWAPIAHRGSKTFTLNCHPTSGTLPEAGRICADIARYPDATLITKQDRSDRWVCAGTVAGPIVTVTVRERRIAYTVSGEPGCGWPPGTALALYWAASQQDSRALAHIEPTLRCGEDPQLLADPTPLVSAVACVHGLWTPRTERLIRTAVKAVPLTGTATARLFPRDIGVQDCTFRSGPALRFMHGRCAVNVTKVWSTPTVTFVQAWQAGGHTRRAHWVVRVTGSNATLIAQGGSIPPQDWT